MLSFAARLVVLLVGSVVSAVSFGWTVRAEIGVGPLFLIYEGLERHLGFTAGLAATACGLAAVALAAALRGSIGPATLIVPILMTPLIDLTLPHLAVPESVALRVVVFVVATSTMMLGGVLIHRAAFGAMALDSSMNALSARSGWSVGRTRVAMEASMVAVGVALGSAVGVGTVITAVLVGHSFALWDRAIDRLSRSRPERIGSARSHSAPADPRARVSWGRIAAARRSVLS